jgi:hypothetical protein
MKGELFNEKKKNLNRCGLVYPQFFIHFTNYNNRNLEEGKNKNKKPLNAKFNKKYLLTFFLI